MGLSFVFFLQIKVNVLKSAPIVLLLFIFTKFPFMRGIEKDHLLVFGDQERLISCGGMIYVCV